MWVSSETISLLYVDAVSCGEAISRLQEALSTLWSLSWPFPGLMSLPLARPAFASRGGFEGHLYPGLSFFFYGLYHAQLVFRASLCNYPVRHLPCRPRSQGRWARLQQIHYIGLVKILSACLLVAQEMHNIQGQFVLISKIYHQRNFLYHKQWQHLTLYASVFLSGCVDAVSQNLLPRRCAALELGAQALGTFLFLPLMVSHMQDSEGVELQCHLLLTQAVFLLTLAIAAEVWAPDRPQLGVTRAFFYMITGSWLIQIGFILHRPVSGYEWTDDDKNNIIFVTTFFCWHVTSVAVLMIWIYGFFFLWYRYISCCPNVGEPETVPVTCTFWNTWLRNRGKWSCQRGGPRILPSGGSPGAADSAGTVTPLLSPSGLSQSHLLSHMQNTGE